MTKNEELWKLLESINEWIRFSDAKAVALLGIQGLFIGFLVDNRTSWLGLSGLLFALFGLGLLCNAASIGCAFLCLNPNLRQKGRASILYFGAIANGFSGSDEYQKCLDDSYSTASQQRNQLCGQIYENSCIANKKFRLVAYSLRLFLVSLILWSLAVVIKL